MREANLGPRAGAAAAYDDRAALTFVPEAVGCDLCGAAMAAGLRGFDVFASCADCDGFDVCLPCIRADAAAAATAAGPRPRGRKKAKRGRGLASEASAAAALAAAFAAVDAAVATAGEVPRAFPCLRPISAAEAAWGRPGARL